MYYVKRAIVWLYRWKHCRGFGVQSPTDYRFVRYVINEHAPFYAYRELANQYPQLTKEERRFSELLLRVANHRQPLVSVCLYGSHPVYHDYILAGCKKSKVYEMKCGELFNGKADLICCHLETGDSTTVEMLTALANEHCILVVKNIWHQPSRDLWASLLQHPAVTISYDLYDCGIIIFDKKRYKHNYIINF